MDSVQLGDLLQEFSFLRTHRVDSVSSDVHKKAKSLVFGRAAGPVSTALVLKAEGPSRLC